MHYKIINAFVQVRVLLAYCQPIFNKNGYEVWLSFIHVYLPIYTNRYNLLYFLWIGSKHAVLVYKLMKSTFFWFKWYLQEEKIINFMISFRRLKCFYESGHNRHIHGLWACKISSWNKSHWWTSLKLQLLSLSVHFGQKCDHMDWFDSSQGFEMHLFPMTWWPNDPQCIPPCTL